MYVKWSMDKISRGGGGGGEENIKTEVYKNQKPKSFIYRSIQKF
jgi:hypothetical protein